MALCGVLVGSMGCTTTSAVVLPGVSGSAAAGAEAPRPARVGDEVLVIATSGAEYRGHVVRVSSESVVVGRDGNFGYKEYEIEAGEIASVEKVNGGSVWPYVAVVGGAFVLWGGSQLSQMD